MAMMRIIQLIIFGAIYCFTLARSSSLSTNEQSADFFTQKLNSNLRQRYNSHLLRLRRSVDTTSISSGTTFKVGACRLEDFLHSAKNCSHKFYTTIRAKGATRKNCGDEYADLKNCMKNTLSNCLEGSRLARQYLTDGDVKEIIDNFMVFVGNEEFWCDKGGVGISSDYLPSGAMCDPVFYHVSESCTEKYRTLFNSSASDEKLCNEYEKAKKCYLETIFHHCTFSRMLQQILEIMIEITGDFQPFCHRTEDQEKLTLEKLLRNKNCPPYSIADVAFALDVTNGTDKRQYISMKRMIETLLQTMDYGSRGIQISLFHFDSHLRKMLKFGGIATKRILQRYIRKMALTTTKSKNKARRLTGRSLSILGRTTFSRDKGGNKLVKDNFKSGQRPHNTAVVFVLTTGPSSDSMVSGLELLKDRNVHVVFVGPSTLKIPTTSNKIIQTAQSLEVGNGLTEPGTYRVIQTNFKLNDVGNVAKEMAGEICLADRKKQLIGSERVAEVVSDNSKWQNIQRLLSRFGEYDLSLLFELKPIVSPYTQATIPSSRPRTNLPFFPTEGISEGMDGDNYFGQPIEAVGEIGGWPFYISEQEYFPEAPY